MQVSRAEALLRNLEQERDRWSLSSESFTKQLQSLIGDSLLAAAFVTYVGVFDYRTRKVSVREEIREERLFSAVGPPGRPGEKDRGGENKRWRKVGASVVRGSASGVTCLPKHGGRVC